MNMARPAGQSLFENYFVMVSGAEGVKSSSCQQRIPISSTSCQELGGVLEGPGEDMEHHKAVGFPWGRNEP